MKLPSSSTRTPSSGPWRVPSCAVVMVETLRNAAGPPGQFAAQVTVTGNVAVCAGATSFSHGRR